MGAVENLFKISLHQLFCRKFCETAFESISNSSSICGFAFCFNAYDAVFKSKYVYIGIYLKVCYL